MDSAKFKHYEDISLQDPEVSIRLSNTLANWTALDYIIAQRQLSFDFSLANHFFMAKIWYELHSFYQDTSRSKGDCSFLSWSAGEQRAHKTSTVHRNEAPKGANSSVLAPVGTDIYVFPSLISQLTNQWRIGRFCSSFSVIADQMQVLKRKRHELLGPGTEHQQSEVETQ